MATRQILAELADRWRQAGGFVAFEAAGGVEVARRVRSGEPFDVVVLATEELDKLVAENRIVSDSTIDLARSSVAIAVRSGASWPCVQTEAGLRDAILAAATIGYSTGPSGVALQSLFESWGISATIRPRVVQAPPGVPVGKLIAQGDVELGFQQLSELIDVDGIDVIGSMPSELKFETTFACGVGTTSQQISVARAFLNFARSPAADDVKRRYGMQPV